MSSVILVNNRTDDVKTVPVGFSFTIIFFGFFVPMVRGDLKGTLIGFGFSWLAWFVGNIIFAFFYNKRYINSLLDSGYDPIDEATTQLLKEKNIIKF
jgi:hypothetical protein